MLMAKQTKEIKKKNHFLGGGVSKVVLVLYGFAGLDGHISEGGGERVDKDIHTVFGSTLSTWHVTGVCFMHYFINLFNYTG